MMCGGAGETKAADQDVQAICDQVYNYFYARGPGD